MMASGLGHTEVVQELIAGGANLNMCNEVCSWFVWSRQFTCNVKVYSLLWLQLCHLLKIH